MQRRTNKLPHAAREVAGRVRRHLVIGDVVDNAHEVRSAGGHETNQREALGAAQQHVGATVRELLRLLDLGDAPHRTRGDISLRSVVQPRQHTEFLVAGQAVLHQPPIARLEDVQRHRCLGKQDYCEREESASSRWDTTTK